MTVKARSRALIEIKQLTKHYTIANVKQLILRQLSLSITQGELVAIVGSSGSGKSTLMNIIGLLDKSDSGEYWLAHQAVATLNQDELASLRNRYIGFVFQQFNLLSRFSAWQNVALPLVYRQVTGHALKHAVDEALARVGMSDFANRRPTQLSGGQQQRIAIARALVGEPQVLLADEPTGALDSKTGEEVMALFHTLHAEGRTILMVTHDKQIAAQCSRQILLADGQIVNQTTIDELVELES